MELFVDLLAASFSSASLGDKFTRSLFCGLIAAIPGLVLFYIFWTQTKKDENRWKSMWPTAWIVLAVWFLFGFTFPWIIWAINPRM